MDSGLKATLMDFNSFIFPIPAKKPLPDRLKEHLIWVPVYENSLSKIREYRKPQAERATENSQTSHTQSSKDLFQGVTTKPVKYIPFSSRTTTKDGQNLVPKVQMKHFTPLMVSKGDLTAPTAPKIKSSDSRVAKRIFLSSTGDSQTDPSKSVSSANWTNTVNKSTSVHQTGAKQVEGTDRPASSQQPVGFQDQVVPGEGVPKRSFAEKMALFNLREPQSGIGQSSHKLLLSKIGNPLSRVKKEGLLHSGSVSNVTIKLQTKTLGPQEQNSPIKREPNLQEKKTVLDAMSQT